MEIIPIFGEDPGNLWAVQYAGDDEDIFYKLVSLWNDTEYLLDFFEKNQKKLLDIFWKGISIDAAIDQVQMEIRDFEAELFGVEKKLPNYRNTSLANIFEPLHENIYSIKTTAERYRKARANPTVSKKSIIRFYAIELDDNCFIISGGCLKLTKKMHGPEFDLEFKRLDQLKAGLRERGISDQSGLL